MNVGTARGPVVVRFDDAALGERLVRLLGDRAELGTGADATGAEYSVRTADPRSGTGPRSLPALFEGVCPVQRHRDSEVLVHRLLQLLALRDRPGQLVADVHLVAEGDRGILLLMGLDDALVDAEARLVRRGVAVARGPHLVVAEPPHVDLTPVVDHPLPDGRGARPTDRIQLAGIVHAGPADRSTALRGLLTSLRPDRALAAQAAVDAAMAIVHRVEARSITEGELPDLVAEMLGQ